MFKAFELKVKSFAGALLLNWFRKLYLKSLQDKKKLKVILVTSNFLLEIDT